MDADHFDTLTRFVPAAGSRRRALVAVLGGSLAAFSLRDSGAKKKKKKKKAGPTCPTPERCPTPEMCPTPRPVTVACPTDPTRTGEGGALRQAQTFTAPNTGQLISAQVELTSGAAGNDYTVEIRTLGDAGQPSDTVLASTLIENVPATSVDVPLTLIANFVPFVPVQAGTGYALVVTVDPGPIMNLRTRPTGTCPGQRFQDGLADGRWVLTGRTLVFSVTIVV